MANQAIKEKYQACWDRFVEGINEVQDDLGRLRDGSENLHETLQSIQWIPYDTAHRIVGRHKDVGGSRNIGAVTGLFFEQMIAAALIPYVKRRCEQVWIERNQCSGRNGRNIPRDPDIYFRNGEREAVVEIKVSPKKRDIDKAEEMHKRYENEGVGFFFVGGQIVLNRERLETFQSQNWACFLDAKERNRYLLPELPSLDKIAEELVAHLNGMNVEEAGIQPQ